MSTGKRADPCKCFGGYCFRQYCPAKKQRGEPEVPPKPKEEDEMGKKKKGY